MPALLTLQLAAPRPVDCSPRQLLGTACRMLEADRSDHRVQVKPFAVGPLARAAGDGWAEPGSVALAWRLGWLAEEDPPPWPPTRVDLGGADCQVVGHGYQAWPFARLAAATPARRVGLRVLTPMFFSRNGRDLPLPDPVLIVRSLVERWNAHAPADLGIAEEDARAVSGAVYLAGMTGGRTAKVVVLPRVRQLGFLGEIDLALTRAADTRMASVFAGLMRFAGIAGVGAQTTFGFGAVDVRPASPPGR